MIQILLVDDHPAVGMGTKSMIEQDESIKVTVVTSGGKALELVEQGEAYDVYLFDLYMPTINGLELTKRVLKLDSEAVILIYTGFEIEPHFNLLVEAGVNGFISKTASQEQLNAAIKCALRNEAVVPVTLLKQLRRSDAKASVGKDGEIEDVSIDEKEQFILYQISLGKSNQEIAQALFMSQRTVEYKLTNIFRKLKVRSRAEAVMKGKEIGLIPNHKII